jgi:hypothetical protein
MLANGAYSASLRNDLSPQNREGIPLEFELAGIISVEKTMGVNGASNPAPNSFATIKSTKYEREANTPATLSLAITFSNKRICIFASAWVSSCFDLVLQFRLTAVDV